MLLVGCLCGLKLASLFIVSGIFLEGFPCIPILALPVTSLGQPSRRYIAIYGWLLPVLDLETCGGELVLNQAWLPPLFGLGKLSQRPRAPMPDVTCWLPVRFSHWESVLRCMDLAG